MVADIVSFIEGRVDFLDRRAELRPQLELLLGDHIEYALPFAEFDGLSFDGRLLLFGGQHDIHCINGLVAGQSRRAGHCAIGSTIRREALYVFVCYDRDCLWEAFLAWRELLEPPSAPNAANMSDNFERLVDPDVTAEDAKSMAQRVIEEFRAQGLITGDLNADCVLGGQGYRPGLAIPDLYVLTGREAPFWQLLTCGVEPEIGRHFNVWALGPEFDGLTCPTCGAVVRYSDSFGDAVANAIREWNDQSGDCLLECPVCAGGRSICDWACKPPLAFGNLSFTFWNWPPLDSTAWKIDIAALVAKTTGHPIVRTWGHI